MANAARPAILGPDRAMVERAFDALVVSGDVTELRWITNQRTHGTVAGYFNDREKFVTAVVTHAVTVEAPATYMLLNPGRPELLARYFNRLQWRVHKTTADPDILIRRRILGDCDARRPVSEISATDSEHSYAIERMFMMAEQLRKDHGWGAPIQADSGNGGHNIWTIHEPNDTSAAQLIKRVHQALDKRFSDERVEIDPAVFNAARLTKVYGTPACKGDNVPDRPHRLSALLNVPEFTEIVTREQLEEVARSGEPQVHVNGTGPGERSRGKSPDDNPGSDEADETGPKKRNKKRKGFDIETFIAQHFPEADGPEPTPDGGRRWKLQICPFDAAHDDGKASIYESADGTLGFHCFHAACAGNGWKELRSLHRDDDKAQRAEADFAQAAEEWDAAAGAGRAVPDPVPVPNLLRQPTTDFGNALRLCAMFGSHIRYCHAFKKWFIWDGCRWREDTTGEIRRLVKRMIAEFLRQAVIAAKKDLIKFAYASQDQRDLLRIEASARDHLYIEPNRFDAHPFLLSCLNGTLDLKTRTIRPHSADDYITKLIHVNYSPQAQCPRFRKFLAEILPSRRLRAWLRRVIGYALTGDTSARAVFIFFGKPLRPPLAPPDCRLRERQSSANLNSSPRRPPLTCRECRMKEESPAAGWYRNRLCPMRTCFHS